MSQVVYTNTYAAELTSRSSGFNFFGRGVCGAAARTRQTQVVDDVNAFPGHIACDSRSLSEIVVPVLDAHGRLIAVFDVDATELAAFDEADALGLERIMSEVFAA